MTPEGLKNLLSTFPALLVPANAGAFLKYLESITHLLSLYQYFFPDEFQQAMEQRVSLFPEPGNSYSPCELQFFDLVDSRFFPLPLDYMWDDPFEERQFAYMIPVEGIGFDFERDEYDDLPFGWQIMLYLLGEVDEEFMRRQSGFEDDELLAIPVQRGECDKDLLTLRCEAQGGSLAFLPLALAMLHNETDSVWLNVTVNDPCTDAYWTKEDMENLKKQYLLALEIRHQAEAFCTWLEERPLTRFAQVARLWNACVRDTPPFDPRTQVRVVHANQFVEGTGLVDLFGHTLLHPTPILLPPPRA
jgi:hypothetical protein